MPHVSPSKQDHVSPLLHSLRSLPVTQIIDCLQIVFRVLLCCERYRSGLLACPNCGASTTLLANSVLFLIPDCLESLHSKLRQTDKNMFRIKLQLAIWTKLPETIRYSESMSSLKSGLKPHLVKQWIEIFLFLCVVSSNICCLQIVSAYYEQERVLIVIGLHFCVVSSNTVVGRCVICI